MRNIWVSVFMLSCPLVVAPCAADDSPVNTSDTSAYQTIQLLNQNELLKSEVEKLRGQIEDLLQNARQSQKSRKKIAADFDSRLSKIEAIPSADITKEKARIAELEGRMLQLEQTIAAMHELISSSARAPVQENAAEVAYEAALANYEAGDYAAASNDLRTFLDNFGNEPTAPYAVYWLAEAQFHEGNFSSAIETSAFLISRHPTNEKAPDAIFLVGKAHLGMGDTYSARNAWEKLVADHPDSSVASKARDLLERLP